MKLVRQAAIAVFSALTLMSSARADTAFSGSGLNGTLASATESWAFNADGGAAYTGYLNNWGSPGVDLGFANYGEAAPAYGFVITFSGGGPIDAASIGLGNTGGCSGTTTGGTTFCAYGSTYAGWEPFLTGPDTLYFLAQDPTASLGQGDYYFTNVFFDGASPTSFSGSWINEYATTPSAITPEPCSLALLGTGLAGLLAQFRSRQRR